MIIACPACATRYVVPDSAIGLEGRTVRCAKCKHSWFQDGPEIEAVRPAPAASWARPAYSAPAAPDLDPRPLFGAAPSTTRSGPSGGPSAAAGTPSEAIASFARSPSAPPSPDTYVAAQNEPGEDASEGPSFDEGDPPYRDLPRPAPAPPVYDDTVSQFDYAPPFKPRRNYLKLWTWAAAIFAIIALGTVVAVNTIGLPDWVPVSRPLFAMAQPDLELAFPVEEQERRTLPDGTEFFGARIVVTNTARESRDVPPILIVLRDGRERIVYSWEVTPPQRTLTPGEGMTINEAITDVPKSAVFADIGWAPR